MTDIHFRNIAFINAADTAFASRIRGSLKTPIYVGVAGHPG